MIELEFGEVGGPAVMGEQGALDRAEHAPLVRSSVAEGLLPTFTTWGQPVRKSRISLHSWGVQTQGPELSDELEGHYGVGWAVVDA